MSEDLVSVVIPTRNRPELLLRAVRSALDQTHQNLEVLVVVDGPDVVTRFSLDQIVDSRLTILYLNENVGGSEARNIGVQHARGRWIAFLDDDDEWFPRKVEEQVRLASGSIQPEKCLVLTQYFYVRQKSGIQVVKGGSPNPGEPISEFILSNRGGYQSSVFFASRILLQAIPFTRGLKRHQDWDWLFRASAAGDLEVLVVRKPLAKYWILDQARRVSDQTDWEFSFDWASEMRQFITPKAYSMFLLKTCLRSAIRQSEGWISILKILSRAVFSGSASMALLVKAACMVLLPESCVVKIGDFVLSRASRYL